MTLFSSLSSARRVVAVAATVTIALVTIAVPAGAAKPAGNGNGKPPSPVPAPAGTTMQLHRSIWATPNTCVFDADYTWSGLKGRGYNLSVKLYDSTGAVIANPPQVQSLTSGGDFTFIFNFTGAPGPQRGIYARGV